VPYRFNFDLSGLSRSFFAEVIRLSGEKNIHGRLGERARYLAKKFRIRELTGLDVSDALRVIEDLISVYVENVSQRERFLGARRRALFLPHCARKHMDAKCRARFDPERSTYQCAHCSPDCPVHRATSLAEGRGYDVYVLPGGSCIPRILRGNRYEGVVGVACCEELKLAAEYLKRADIPGQGVPLVRNGCSHTEFNIQSLRGLL